MIGWFKKKPKPPRDFTLRSDTWPYTIQKQYHFPYGSELELVDTLNKSLLFVNRLYASWDHQKQEMPKGLYEDFMKIINSIERYRVG